MVTIASQSLILLHFCTGHSSIWNIPECNCSHYFPVSQDLTFSSSCLSLHFFLFMFTYFIGSFPFFFPSGSHIIWASLQLSVKLLLSLNSGSSCLYFSSTGILRGVWYHTQPSVIFGVLNTVDFPKHGKDQGLLFIFTYFIPVLVWHTLFSIFPKLRN